MNPSVPQDRRICYREHTVIKVGTAHYLAPEIALGQTADPRQLPNGKRRIMKICEVVGIENDTAVLKDLFEYRLTGADGSGYHTATGLIPQALPTLRQNNFDVDVKTFFAPQDH